MKIYLFKVFIGLAVSASLGALYAADYFGERVNRFERLSERKQLRNEAMYLEAEKLYDQGKWRDAVGAFDYVARKEGVPIEYRAKAHVKIAKMYYLGGNGIPKDYARALQHSMSALNAESAFWEDLASVCLHVGQMYCKGGNGVERDLKSARSCLIRVVLNAQALPADCASARLGLGLIYYLGGNGIEKNYAYAREYFNQVIEDQQALQADRDSAQKCVNCIADIEAPQIHADNDQMNRRASI